MHGFLARPSSMAALRLSRSSMPIIQVRRDPAYKWAASNPVLREGEPGYERDTRRFKIGDGVARWLDLDYYLPASAAEAETLLGHINSSEPHPIYDDGPSLILLYENAKV